MSDSQVQEWTLEGVLDELARVDSSMQDRHFAFILGSGASFSSNIPTGKDLAQSWLRDLHLRECTNGAPVEDWVASSGIIEGDLTYERAAEFYPQIFERRFRGDRESGYAELEKHMDGKTPSLGYTLLAEIIQETRHKVVITTNFDNLVADALSMHAHKSPLVVAHESLVGFVRPQLRRPLVAKIHRDLYLNPINDQNGISNLEEGWKHALKKLFQHFTPIVIGYGGNDGSLMGLLNSLAPDDIAGRMVWCYKEGASLPPLAQQVLTRHDGIKVGIEGFDEFMLQLAGKLVPGFDLNRISERTEELGKKSAERYRKQAEHLVRKLAESNRHKADAVVPPLAQARSGWWSWEVEAAAQMDPAKIDEIYRKGLAQYPESYELMYNYANFLSGPGNDTKAARAMYEAALKIAPDEEDVLCNYADLLEKSEEFDNALEVIERAWTVDPSDADIQRLYARILGRKAHTVQASDMFRKALEAHPDYVPLLTDFADYLSDVLNDYALADEYYQKAVSLDPGYKWAVENYAKFLAFQYEKPNQAKMYYQKALELSPEDEGLRSSYTGFLQTLDELQPT
ncbi:tetratricopeptide repeat protein [Pseudomonas cichorii]|uniref:tetratricopeptide repeat protein n=1 Tax=Pseudomonas cichorii TaxID=36746 RepID=UPI001C89936F|nr:tetratricopeptide repeat protein [Pseudomonas cichorii]MBX8573663.1 tetratricopeptide repeat protein [Pseudomonas cichorii]